MQVVQQVYDFFEDPDKFREAALNIKYYQYDNHPRPSFTDAHWYGKWNGLRTDYLLRELQFAHYQELAEGFVRHMATTGAGYRLEMYMQFSSEIDEDITKIHQMDPHFNYVGVLNLTPDVEGQDRSSIEFYDPSAVYAPYRPLESEVSFKTRETIDTEYNKLVIFDSAEFVKHHANIGKSIEEGDLSLVFMFKLL
jgi:hypothetical protein